MQQVLIPPIVTVSTKCSSEMLHLHVPDMHEFGSIQVFYIEGKAVYTANFTSGWSLQSTFVKINF